jgi:hypothetical protein
MIKLEFTEATGLGYRHRTWTRIGQSAHRLSALQNQFALWEYELPEEEALKQFRVWLWHELQDKYNVVSTEMRQLARAHQREAEVEILVPKNAPHGALIVRALLWLADNADLSEPMQTRWTEPGPTYEPILPDGAIICRAKIDPKYIVWIHGNRQSRIGVVVAYGQAFVPEYGIVPLKRFRWVNRKLAQSPKLQELLNDALDQAFVAEEGNEPVEYEPFPAYATEERFDSWAIDESLEEVADNEEWVAMAEADVRTPVEQLAEEVGDTATAHAILQVLSIGTDEQVVYPFGVESEMIRPVYKHKGENEPLKVKSAEDQVNQRRWRYATRDETQYYLKTFRNLSHCIVGR